MSRGDHCVRVEVTGVHSFEEVIRAQIANSTFHDILMFPQPGYVKDVDLADEIVPLDADTAETVQNDFHTAWTDLVRNPEGALLAVPVKADIKSLVWYSPTQLANHGYVVPQSQDEYYQLVIRMANEGNAPICLGLGEEDSASVGWPFTDWVEEYILRGVPASAQSPGAAPIEERLRIYDQWANHDIPFDDPRVVTVGRQVHSLLSYENFVYGGLPEAATRSIKEAGEDVLDGDCMTYRMSNSYAAIWRQLGADIGEDVDFFALPGPREDPALTLSGGMYAAAFSDHPLVGEAMRYLASTEYAQRRAGDERGGFLSPHNEIDPSEYANDVEGRLAQVLEDAVSADAIRFDASDRMPSDVGADRFWDVSVEIVLGAKSVDEAFAEIESDWPPG